MVPLLAMANGVSTPAVWPGSDAPPDSLTTYTDRKGSQAEPVASVPGPLAPERRCSDR